MKNIRYRVYELVCEQLFIRKYVFRNSYNVHYCETNDTIRIVFGLLKVTIILNYINESVFSGTVLSLNNVYDTDEAEISFNLS